MLTFDKFLFVWWDLSRFEPPLHLLGGPGCLDSLRRCLSSLPVKSDAVGMGFSRITVAVLKGSGSKTPLSSLDVHLKVRGVIRPLEVSF